MSQQPPKQSELTTTTPNVEEFEEEPSFKLFPKLPEPLRMKIWKFVDLSHIRKVEVIASRKVVGVANEYYNSGELFIVSFRLKTPIPQVLHVCQESRHVGLKTYMKMIPVFHQKKVVGRMVYVNVDTDALFIRSFRADVHIFLLNAQNPLTKYNPVGFSEGEKPLSTNVLADMQMGTLFYKNHDDEDVYIPYPDWPVTLVLAQLKKTDEEFHGAELSRNTYLTMVRNSAGEKLADLQPLLHWDIGWMHLHYGNLLRRGEPWVARLQL